MTKITRTVILDTAAELVEQKGVDGVTLADVGSQLGISHAALYKYFKNKRDLWTSLSLRWLDAILRDIFPFDTTGYTSKAAIAHDWLWDLAQGKMNAYKDDPTMFTLYTEYIDANEDVLAIHVGDLVASLKQALGTDDEVQVRALISAFAQFTTPVFAKSWGPQSQADFEAIWRLVEPSLRND
ncbi:TetR/AcrR family transcriptional regulator [Lacticaseibacillus saniviri]|uniref:TetR/AcrR family transcriptional regulator n=1 Tax=Lacticaseibacillus saniviri TaxID=931533 RepID=UPI0006D1DDD3|nr:TetR/AcrR family transcriptional regulator [Lacticaseibacillus saniviri]MCG4281389.1 TetR/AcrR family transcriptional regulator [Lacticaseibacillus saniviri]